MSDRDRLYLADAPRARIYLARILLGAIILCPLIYAKITLDGDSTVLAVAKVCGAIVLLAALSWGFTLLLMAALGFPWPWDKSRE